MQGSASLVALLQHILSVTLGLNPLEVVNVNNHDVHAQQMSLNCSVGNKVLTIRIPPVIIQVLFKRYCLIFKTKTNEMKR